MLTGFHDIPLYMAVVKNAECHVFITVVCKKLLVFVYKLRVGIVYLYIYKTVLSVDMHDVFWGKRMLNKRTVWVQMLFYK